MQHMCEVQRGRRTHDVWDEQNLVKGTRQENWGIIEDRRTKLFQPSTRTSPSDALMYKMIQRHNVRMN
jgi:hypothetical protein